MSARRRFRYAPSRAWPPESVPEARYVALVECAVCGDPYPKHAQFYNKDQLKKRKVNPTCRRCEYEERRSEEGPPTFDLVWPPEGSERLVAERNIKVVECSSCHMRLPESERAFRRLPGKDRPLSKRCRKCDWEAANLPQAQTPKHLNWPPPYRTTDAELVTCTHERPNHAYANWELHAKAFRERVVNVKRSYTRPHPEPWRDVKPDEQEWTDWVRLPAIAVCAAKCMGATARPGLQAELEDYVKRAVVCASHEFGGLGGPWWRTRMEALLAEGGLLGPPPKTEPCGLVLPFTEEFFGAAALRTKNPQTSKSIKCRRCFAEDVRQRRANEPPQEEQEKARAALKALKERKALEAYQAYLSEITWRWGFEQDPDKA